MVYRRSTSLKCHYDPLCIGSPTYQLAKHVTSLVIPLTGRTSSFVKNSRHIAEMMREVKLLEDKLMVSFDV